jgi:enterochelin esterase-like enzyme
MAMLRLIGLLVVVAGIALGGHWQLVQGMQAPGEVGRLAARSGAACH